MPISQVPFAGISNPVDFRNIVINGDMQIAQRSTSVASITTSGYYTLDRWNIGASSLGTFTMSQSTDVPSGYGFANSLKLDCTSADATPAAGDYFQLNQLFEGQNLQYLKKGTANALPLTASFWVKSTKTGTFIAELLDLDNSRQISKSYTVNTTNTWEFKTLTFAGDTTGTLNNDNGSSLVLSFWLGAGTTYTSGTLNTSWASITNANRAVGQVNIADSTSNDFLITGVQLEAGEQASGFEFMPIDVNLTRCQRYFEIIIEASSTQNKTIGLGGYYTSTELYLPIRYKVEKRTAPSLVQVTGTDFYRRTSNNSNDGFNQFSIARAGINAALIYNDGQTSGTAGFIAEVATNDTTAKLSMDAEL
jgi:hypothetical protein